MFLHLPTGVHCGSVSQKADVLQCATLLPTTSYPGTHSTVAVPSYNVLLPAARNPFVISGDLQSVRIGECSINP